MAIATGTMTITITESLDVGTTVMDTATSVAKTVTVNDIFKRVITCPTSEIVLYLTHASVPQGYVLDKDLIKYMRITNHDGANFVTLRVTDGNNDEFAYKLAAGESFILWGHAASMSAADAAGAGAVNADIASVEAQADTAACDLEIVIAS